MTAATLTRELAFASGQDAANTAMRKAGRTKWSQEDADLAALTTNKLLLYVPFDKGGLAGVPLTYLMLSDLGLTIEMADAAGAKIAGRNSEAA